MTKLDKIVKDMIEHANNAGTEVMSDKEALQKIAAMVNDYVDNPKEGLLNPKAERLINNLKKVVEKVDSC